MARRRDGSKLGAAARAGTGCVISRRLLHTAMKTTNDKQATAELLAALVEVAIAHGRRHCSESGEPLATTLAVLECLQREGFVTV